MADNLNAVIILNEKLVRLWVQSQDELLQRDTVTITDR